MKLRTVHILSSATLALIVMVGGACGGSPPDESGETGPGGEAERQADVRMDTIFAESLGLDLSSMTRLPSGLYYEDLEPGSGLAARDGHVLETHYTGWLTTGEQFGTSRDGGVYSFQLGRKQAPRGIEEGVTGMRIGGVRRLVVPPSLGYGSRGQPPTIPPSATLVYEIELLDIKL